MLNKLALKNASKNFKDYAIYFFTLTFGICIFYMFNSIDAQKEIMEVTSTTNKSMQLLTETLKYISVFVSIVLGFLIVYANRFFIQRRKKEIGIYEILGINKRQISLILILETIVMAMMALIVGLILGIFLSQFMSVFTAKLFEVNMTKFKFVFSSTALIKSILYFALIFLIVIMFNVITISKYKLIDLLYGSRKNETIKLNNIKLSVLLFITSLICLGISYYFVIKIGLVNLGMLLLPLLLLGAFGTFLFFFSLTGFFTKFIQTKKNIYYKDLNVFILKQINSKINTNFISMSVVCLLLLLTIGILSCGVSLRNVFSKEFKNATPYDVTLYSDTEKTSLKEFLPSNLLDSKYVKNSVEISYYNDDNLKFKDLKEINDKKYMFYNTLNSNFISLSDFNKILEYNKMSKETLENNEYIIISNEDDIKDYVQSYLTENIKIKIDNDELLPKKISNIKIGNGSGIPIFVINDKYISSLKKGDTVLNIELTDYEKYSEDYEKRINDFIEDLDYDTMPLIFSTSRYAISVTSVTTKVIVAFLAIYLGLIFLITSSVILAIQQLTEAEDNIERYKLLNKLGADKKMLNKALFKQISIYFLLPLGLAIIHSIFGLIAANDVISRFGQMNIFGSLLITGCSIVIIYGLYFVTTYVGCKNIINKE